MNKCLITRLNSIVQNNNLNRFGHLVLKIENATVGSTTKFAGYCFNAAPGTTIRLTGAHFINKNGSNLGTEYIKNKTEMATSIVVDKPNIIMTIFSKYDFYGIQPDGYDRTLFGEQATYSIVSTKDVKYCTKIQALGVFPLRGAIEDFILMDGCKGITEAFTTISHELSGDLSKLPASWYGMNSKEVNKGVITHAADARHGSSFRAISFRNFDQCFDAENYENYLVAMATNAWDSTIQRGHLKQIVYNTNVPPTQKIKEAIWYLKNKMYKDVGDRTRTAGKYFDVYNIDISDIVADPGWLE